MYEALAAGWVIIVRPEPKAGAAGAAALSDTTGAELALAAVVVVLMVWKLSDWIQKRTDKRMRWDAKQAVLAAASRTDADRRRLKDACRQLGVEEKTVLTRLNYFEAADVTSGDAEAIAKKRHALYVGGSDADDVSADDELIRAAQLVAAITDLPPEWLYDCATGRRRLVTEPP